MSVDFNQLKKPYALEELDFETIYKERKEALIELWPDNQQNQIRKTLDRESEPLTKLLQENSYRELLDTSPDPTIQTESVKRNLTSRYIDYTLHVNELVTDEFMELTLQPHKPRTKFNKDFL